MSPFQGIPLAAVDFFAELETHNNRDWWAAHRSIHDLVVKAPMEALASELEDEFGPIKVYRPNRDVRFSADKTPYKDHQGLLAGTGTATGWYAQVSSRGLMVAGGWYAGAPDQVERFRHAVDDDRAGDALKHLVNHLETEDFVIDGEQLKTRPRGVSPDHPRLDLLRHKSLTAAREYGVPDWLDSAAALERVREDWRALGPLLTWLAGNVGDTTMTDRGPGRSRGA
ncbi:MAG: DUF2461 domain-containing protein [Propionicimonas sp.]